MHALPLGKCSGVRACLLISVWCAGSLLHGTTAFAQNVSPDTDLSFGMMAISSSGTVTVHPNGSRTQTGGVYTLSQGGSAAAAQFSIKGKRNTVYAITLPANGTVLLSNGAGQTASLTGFVASPSTGILSGNGTGQFSVGATLSLNGTQAKGSYASTFNVTVNYQ